VDDRERALLDAIWAEPEAREPRAIYADYLSERGDVRGEYIAIRLDRAADDKLQSRATTLETAHGGKWLGAARPFVRTWQLDFAGIVAKVRCEADKLIAGFDHIVALGPRLTIIVTSMRTKKRQTVQRMAALDLARVYELQLGSNALDDKDLAVLAPALRCKRVDLDNNRFGPAGLRALEPHAAHLEHIRLGLWTDAAKSAVTFRDASVPFAQIPNIVAKLVFDKPAGAGAFRC
jgi:uncharacterized protein (TIGR02996 family)